MIPLKGTYAKRILFSPGFKERVMAAARSLLLIIILVLNTTACFAVVEMVRFFSVEKHFLLTVTVP